MKNTNKSETTRQFQKYQSGIVVLFSITMFIVVVLLTYFILGRSEEAMRDSASRLVAINAEQIEININSYLEKMEETAALLFADEGYYLYDRTSNEMDDYSKIKAEEAIMDRIVDIGLMYNYSDFFILYSDNYTVGWKSKVTGALFIDDDMYETFETAINNEISEDAWCFGINDNKDRLFYVKRLNPNAILVTSIYNKELEEVFKHPEALEEFSIRLIDAENNVIFAANKDEIGLPLTEDINGMIEGQSNLSVINSSYLVNVNTCENGWRVVCSVPTEVILRDNEALRNVVIYFAVIFACVVVLFDMFIFSFASHGVDRYMTRLQKKASYDELSGLLNKNSFADIVKAKIARRKQETIGVFVMLDMDNFKTINDKAGHQYGDDVIKRIGNVLSTAVSDGAIVGRVGGDEFSMYVETAKEDDDPEKVTNKISREIRRLIMEFDEEFTVENEKYGTSVSIGVYISENSSEDFEEAYRKADTALYVSKRNGKKQFNIYKEDMKGEE